MKEKRGKQVAGLVAGLTKEDATAFDEILRRIKCASDAKNDADLADKLGLKRSSISTAKTRQMIPSSWVINTANLFNVSSDWLIFGDKRQPQVAALPPTESSPEKTPKEPEITEQMVMDLSGIAFDNLWNDFRQEREARRGWTQIEIVKRFPEFMAWVRQHPERLLIPHPIALKRGGMNYHGVGANEHEDD